MMLIFTITHFVISVCRSCLTRHIVKHAACPSCDAPLPKAKPFLHIRYVSIYTCPYYI
jgi:hypothetical protein